MLLSGRVGFGEVNMGGLLIEADVVGTGVVIGSK
jgi:hypothetical protein